MESSLLGITERLGSTGTSHWYIFKASHDFEFLSMDSLRIVRVLARQLTAPKDSVLANETKGALCFPA